MKIVADTSTLYSPTEGKTIDLTVLPLSVTVNGKTYTEYVDITSKEFVDIVRAGGVPTSSQPSVGGYIETFENADEDTLVLCMADGLSGTYQSAVGARNSVANNEHIHVINTRTLCGPHRYMTNKALKMKSEGASFEAIKAEMEMLCDNHISFLIPSDFDFLKRGGRLTPIAATALGMLKVVPVMTQTEDGKRLESFGIKRTHKKAVDAVCEKLKEIGVNENYLISVSHADVKEQAIATVNQISEYFPNTQIELLDLSPAFITQGGPGCIAIQAIKL
ncbi:MAG: DegV family protein [Erysipelotrichales bacterium]|nr:DegV family protein [Erysipelotrichales bacterium]